MTDIYQPKPGIVGAAKVASSEEYQRLYRQSIDDPDGFWRRQAERLDWFVSPLTISRGGFSEVSGVFEPVRYYPCSSYWQRLRPFVSTT